MISWFQHTVVDTGRLPLFCFFAAFVVAFLMIRISTRLIRAQVRWWPGNITVGGTHIHHAVFGVVIMLVSGVSAIAIPRGSAGWLEVAGVLFGIGSALVLDEFALILRLRDVYWTAEGRESVDAVFVATALTGLLVIGIQPAGVDDLVVARSDGSAEEWLLGIGVFAVHLGLAVVTMLKGKVLTGLLGLFVPLLLVVGAVRLARPASPWARWRYQRDGAEPSRKLERATRRERLRAPLVRAGDRFTDLVAGRPDPS